MNFSSNRNAVLLIMGKNLLSKMAAYCTSMLRRQEDVEILKASSGLDGILSYNRFRPCLVIVEDELPDMPGASVCSILKAAPNGGEAVNVFFIGKSSSYLYSTFADCFFHKPVPFNAAGIILNEFFYRRKLRKSAYLLDIEKTKRKQKETVPEEIETSRFVVSNIFSAFSELSGDGIDYWVGDDGSDLYGFLFDCTGHDLLAFSQTSEIRHPLRTYFAAYQSGMIPSLDVLLYNFNNDQFTLTDDDPTPVAAILFHISFDGDPELRYCSAGMPCFYVDHGAGYEKVMMRNPLIGSWRDAEFEEKRLSLSGVKRILLASDGLSEILYQQKAQNLKSPLGYAKHDDVSGIAIDLK